MLFSHVGNLGRRYESTPLFPLFYLYVNRCKVDSNCARFADNVLLLIFMSRDNYRARFLTIRFTHKCTTLSSRVDVNPKEQNMHGKRLHVKKRCFDAYRTLCISFCR